MINRRTLVIIIVFALVAVAAVLVFKIVRSKAGGEGEAVEADMAVHVGKISRATLHRFVTAYGAVEPEPAGPGRAPADSEIASPVAGVISHIDCVEGQKVAKGAVLFRLDSRVAEVAFEKAQKTVDYAEKNFERQKKLLPVEGTSVKSYQEAEQELASARNELAAAATDLALLKIQAPLAGTVVKINTVPGEAVELNTVLAVIIDLNRLVVTANVPSREAPEIKLGQPGRFGSAAVEGTVVYVGARIDDKTDTVPVRISVPAAAGVNPGQFLTVRVTSGVHPDVLAVPETSVIADFVGAETGQIVVIDGEKGVRKKVTLGFREAGLVEIAGEGLKEGQVIVTTDAYAVPDGTKIHIVE